MADQGGKAQITLSAVDTTKAAFDSVKRNFETLKGSADGLLLKFGSLGVAVTAAFEGISIKSVIDAADELSKLSQRTGIAIDDLSALKYAGDLSNVSIDDLATGIKKLGNNMAAAAGGSKEAAAIFKALGVSVTTVSGGLRASDDVLGDIADKFAGFRDGAAKSADAVLAFGKAGDRLIPFLNQGRAGLQALKEEAQKLGIVLTDEVGKQAEEFNDNLTRLGAAATGAKLALASDLLPTLIDITNQFLDARKAYGSFAAGFLDVLHGSTVKSGIGDTVDEIKQVQQALDDLQKQASKGLLGQLGADQITDTGPDEKQLRSQLDTLQKRLAFQRTQAGRQFGADTGPGEQGPLTITNAPIVKKDDGAADALAALKKNLDARLQLIKQNSDAEQDLLKFDETFVQRAYDTGNTSLEAFYTAQDEIRRRGLEDQREALTASIAAEQQYQTALKTQFPEKVAELIESQSKVKAAKAKLAQVDRDAQQAAALSAIDRPDALANQKRQLDIFQGQFADMVDGTRTRAAEFADIAVKVEAARKQLVQGGVDDASAQQQAQQLGVLLKAQHDFNVARDEFTRVTDRAKDAEDALALVQQQNGTGLLASEKQLTTLREQELEQLGKALEATRAIAAANPGNETLVAGLRQAELAYAHLAATADATKLRLDAAADGLGSGIAETLGKAVIDGGKLRDILSDIGKQIVTTVTNEAIVKPISADIGNFIKGAGGAGAGENLIGLLTGQNGAGAKGQTGGAQLPAIFTGAGATADTVTKSLSDLKITGVDPTTVALANLQRAANDATPALGGKVDASGSPSKFVGPPAEDAASASDQAAAATNDQARASVAAADAINQLASSAGKGGGALSLLPSIVRAVTAAISSSSSSGSGSGLLGFFANLFGGSSGFSGGTASASGFSAASTYDLGGFTGYKGTKEVAGVVHGREFVFSAPAVATLGANYLQNMHVAARAGVRGYESGGYVGRMPGAQAWPAANSAPAQRPIIVNINQQFAAGATQQTTSQAALQAGREFARASRRGSA